MVTVIIKYQNWLRPRLDPLKKAYVAVVETFGGISGLTTHSPAQKRNLYLNDKTARWFDEHIPMLYWTGMEPVSLF